MGQPMADDLGFLLSRASGLVVRATNAALAEHGPPLLPLNLGRLPDPAAEAVLRDVLDRPASPAGQAGTDWRLQRAA